MNYEQLIFAASPILMFHLLVHFFADFGLQTHDQAIGKSKEWKPLLQHTGVYSLMYFFAIYIWFPNVMTCLIFALITFVLHTTTDYFTSRLVSDFNKKEDYHNMFVVIGFDQILHLLQLWITHYLMYKI